jgi:hypothetical protein
MPVVPQPNAQGIVRSLGFNFDFGDAFTTTAEAQGIPVNTSFSTLQASLGTSTDTYPTQATAWGRANQAYTRASQSGTVPNGVSVGQVPVWNGTEYTVQGANLSLRLGTNSGANSQGTNSVAVGTGTGRYTQGMSALAIGFQAGQDFQGANATAVGDVAGRSYQGARAIAIGSGAGYSNQGTDCIAIGVKAGETNQPANTIVLNASGAALNAAQPGGMYVNPIRNDNANPNWLTYNNMSGEITFDTALPLSLGASTDAPSLTTSVWAYANQAEIDAQNGIASALVADTTANTALTTANTASANSSMVWDFRGQLAGTTVCNLSSLPAPDTNKWTTAYQLIRTMTATIPAGWIPRNSTTITLFIFNTFSANHATLQYFEYSINSETTFLPLAETSPTQYYGNQGLSQYNAITGVLTGIPLAPGNVVRVRQFGRTQTGTHVMSNPTDNAWGVFSTIF